MQQEEYKNKLLRRFTLADFDFIRRHLEPAVMKTRETLVRPNYPVEHVWFPESGQISVLCKVQQSEPIEVGIIGFEGMTDMAFGDRSPLTNLCQIEGAASRVRLETIQQLYRESRAFADLMGRYHTYMLLHVSYTALAHGSFTVEERLARWLLMVQDRIGSPTIPLAHDFLSWMLSVRRTGVTEAIKTLRQERSISSERGIIHIEKRDALVETAGGSYGPTEAEYERLIEKYPAFACA